MAGKKRPKAGPPEGTLAAQIRQRWGASRGELAIDRLEAELEGSRRYDIVAALKELQKEGLGELRVGRNGHKPSFVWAGGSAPAARVLPGGVARGPTKARATLRPVAPEAPQAPEAPPSSRSSTGILEHSFHVRPHVMATFRLPVDVTPQEIERLCQLLQAIPFR